MAEQQLNAPARASYDVRRSSARGPAGVRKITEHQQPGYTIVGNHLAQHRELSFVARGLATYIQSLPEGAPVDIRTLAKKSSEGRDRIAAALRELEAHGYLERVRRRTDDGRIVTVTISYNDPEATRARRAREAAEETKRRVATEAAAEVTAEAVSEPVAQEVPSPAPAPTPSPAPPPAAVALLANLRRHEPRLLLSVRDIHRLAPDVAAWLERGVSPDDVRSALTSRLPEPVRHPAALIAHRLRELLPPPLPDVPTEPRLHPMQTCDGCERAFRAPEPGARCRDCRLRSPAGQQSADGLFQFGDAVGEAGRLGAVGRP